MYHTLRYTPAMRAVYTFVCALRKLLADDGCRNFNVVRGANEINGHRNTYGAATPRAVLYSPNKTPLLNSLVNIENREYARDFGSEMRNDIINIGKTRGDDTCRQERKVLQIRKQITQHGF